MSTLNSSEVSIGLFIPSALILFGKDWKRVEQHIGTRSGA